MELNGTTCWPHFPGVIARVEELAPGACLQVGGCTYCDGPAVTHAATIFGVTQEFDRYEHAVAWCVEMKDHASALDAYLPAERDAPLPRPLYYPLTNELS